MRGTDSRIGPSHLSSIDIGPYARAEVESVLERALTDADEGVRQAARVYTGAELPREYKVGKPVPGEQVPAGDGAAVAGRGDGLEEGVGAGGEGLWEDGVAGGIEDAEGQRSGVEIDAAVESVGCL